MLPKIIIVTVLILSCGISCSTPKEQDQTQNSANKTESTMKGKIISENFINKGGKEINTMQDLYFQTEDETYFIKFMDSNISFEEAKKLIDQPIEIEGEVREGLWDVPDDNPQYAQSRTGYYVVIFKIK